MRISSAMIQRTHPAWAITHGHRIQSDAPNQYQPISVLLGFEGGL